MESKQARATFPKFLTQSFGSEKVHVVTEEEEINQIFEAMHPMDQTLDQAEAYAFAQTFITTHPLTSMTVEKLEKFIMELHKIAAHTLLAVNGHGLKGGEYSSLRFSWTRETGLDEEFDEDDIVLESPYYSKKNAELLKKMYGSKVAQDYQSFISALNKNLLEKIARLKHGDLDLLREYAGINDNIIFHILKIGLDKRPDYYAYQKVRKFADDAATLKTKFSFFCKTLLKQMQEGQDALQCAAYAFHQFINIHPFGGGHKRTARILMNSVLLWLNQAPLLIPMASTRDYYYLLDRLESSNLTELVKFLKDCKEKTATEKDQASLVDSKTGKISFVIQRPTTLGVSVDVHINQSFYEMKEPIQQTFDANFLKLFADKKISNTIVKNYFAERIKRFHMAKEEKVVSILSSQLLFSPGKMIADAKSIYQKGITAFKNKQFNEAEQLVSHAIDQLQLAKAKEDEIALAYSTLGSCYRELAKWNEAKTGFNQAIEWYQKAGVDKSDQRIKKVEEKLNLLHLNSFIPSA